MTEQNFERILNKISTPIFMAKKIEDSLDFEIVFQNDAFLKKFGDKKSKNLLSEVKLAQNPNFQKLIQKTFESKKTQNEMFYSEDLKDWFKLVFDVVGDESDGGELLIGNVLNVSTEVEKDKQFEFFAFHDALTGLYSRNKFEDDFEIWAKQSKGTDNKFGILFLDIDNMKYVNDVFGHSKGDELICKVGEILKKFERDYIRVYRFGGDEFIVMVNHADSHNTIVNIGDMIRELCNAEGVEFSGGISMYPSDSENLEELLKYADMAMYDVKRTTKNDVGYFQAVMRDRFMNKIIIKNKLSAAFSKGEPMASQDFELHYQPQFDVSTNTLRGFEALLRWHDEDLGWISPEKFIPIAEESKLVIPIGDWVLREAVETLSKWQKEFDFKGIMSVNVSPVQLKKQNFLFNLESVVREFKIPPESLEIEITEGVFIENKEEMLAILNCVRQLGIGISLDDFGTGYSSLSYLQLLPITTLKIDKSFIANITEKSGIEANITDSIVNMVTKMGLDTIAEGVENSAQLDVLKNIKCKTVQGFLKGKPMNKARCEKILNGDYDLADRILE